MADKRSSIAWITVGAVFFLFFIGNFWITRELKGLEEETTQTASGEPAKALQTKNPRQSTAMIDPVSDPLAPVVSLQAKKREQSGRPSPASSPEPRRTYDEPVKDAILLQ